MDDPNTPSPAEDTGRLRAFYELTKPGIAGYVMITAGVAAFVGSGGRLDLAVAVLTMLGTGMATAGALALNQYVEREVDGIMLRTRHRPIPSGRLSPRVGLVFGMVLLVSGLFWLLVLVHWLPAATPGSFPTCWASPGCCGTTTPGWASSSSPTTTPTARSSGGTWWPGWWRSSW